METNNQVFWGEMAPCDHLVQIYEDDEIFVHALTGFTENGFQNGDSVIIIATDSHLSLLEKQLNQNHDLAALKLSGRFIPVNAEDALSSFVIDDIVDEALFRKFVNGLITISRQNNHKVRAFGELVAVLWGQGNRQATYKLESLWDEFCKSDLICLFCAYPKSGFRQNARESIEHICSLHSKMIQQNTASPEIDVYGSKLSFTSLR